MLMTTMVVVLVTTLAGLGTTMAIRDMRGAGHAQQAGTALGSAEAGVAQAISYIRSHGTRKLCSGPTCTNAWSQSAPVTASTAGGGEWEAWIEPLSVGNPDGDTYRVQSTGRAGGPAERTIQVEVTVTPIDLPKAVFGRTINLGGSVEIEQISVFSTGCVFKRDKLTSLHASGLDAAYGVPIGVHSSQIITRSQGSGQYCAKTSQPIHGGLSLLGLSLNPCNSTFPYDQDRLGGAVSGLQGVTDALGLCPAVSALTPYQPLDVDLNGQLDVNGSFLRDDAALFRTFGITRPALTESEMENLRAIAQSQDSYFDSTSWTVPDGNVHPHTVLFFDLDADETVDLKPLEDSVWSRGRITDPLNLACIDASLLIVVTGGNARLNGDTELAASVYLSGTAGGGQLFKANGTADHIGMLYADTIDLTGDLKVSLDACYIANPPPGLFDVNPGTYRELDR